MSNFSVIIPTLNAGGEFTDLLLSLESQSIQPAKKLIIDSFSRDQTVAIAKSFQYEVKSIEPESFNHGATRQMGVELVPDTDIIIFLTQDVILYDFFVLEKLVSCFNDVKIGAAYGRQIPHKKATPIAAHARLFNYPPNSNVKSLSDVSTFGLKTAFISNSFAAYKRQALIESGGFPDSTILSEDMYVAAKMLLNGWKIAYCSEAKVFHSHNYNYRQEFRRYFDIGVFQSREPWIRQNFGQAGGEGLKFVRSELMYLWKKNFLLIPSAIIRSILKLLAFKLGFLEKKIPRNLKMYLSMNSKFWR